MKMKLNYKNEEHIFEEREEGGVPFLEYPLFSELNMVKHGLSTRQGGVSEGIFTSMNLHSAKGEQEGAVRENFRRFTNAIEVKAVNTVFPAPTHATNIRVVTKEDCGKGLFKHLDYTGIDGLVTNVPQACLVTFYADCVPLFFVDPVKKAIGLSHSGWRGTVGKIGLKTVEKMTAQYGCDPKDIRAAIGPSICQGCYEVSEDVIEEFRRHFDVKYHDLLFYQKENEKYQLDLWKANELIFAEAGIQSSHTAVTNLCSCCNADTFFSHRASKGKRGNLGAFLELQ